MEKVDAVASVPAQRGSVEQMATPRIAVTGMWSNRVHGMRHDGNAVAAAVLKSIVRAGGEPLTYFAEGPTPAYDRLEGMHGLVIPGGFDIDPARYGQDPHPTTVTADFAQQDQFEIDMISAAMDRGLPLLLICRGFQIFNVMQGGNMIQDLPKDSVHRDDVHQVEIAEDSLLAEVIGQTQIEVSSYHHQAVDKLGKQLRAVATGPAGIVEAIEHSDADVLAVQWHPEDTSDTDPKQAAMFEWLIEKSRLKVDPK